MHRLVIIALLTAFATPSIAVEHDDAWRAEVVKPRNSKEEHDCRALKRRIMMMDKTIVFHCEGDE